MSETCRHCGHSIEPHSADYTHGWRHLGGSVWCKRSMAQPMEDEPAVPSDHTPSAAAHTS